MAMEIKELRKLLALAATADKASPVAYSFGEDKFTGAQVVEAARIELKELAGDMASYRRNQNIIFELIEGTIDDVLPRKVMEQYGQFAEVRVLAQGDKPVFTQRITEASRRRAKSFVTKVGLAGVYETFKLDGKSVEVEIMAIGGAAMIGLEEFLDGRITFGDVLDIVMMALDEVIYTEIAKALVASIAGLPTANKVSGAGFVEDSMDRLLQIAASYGQPTIYCTYEFATQMVPETGWVSDEMRNTRWNVGYLANYKGTRVIVLPQSYTDETNETKVIDPSYAWIIPAGGNDKPVKIAFEGQTITNEHVNRDGSREIQVYKKLGVATIITNNICSYRNTDLGLTGWL